MGLFFNLPPLAPGFPPTASLLSVSLSPLSKPLYDPPSSYRFYEIKRPDSFLFDGSWLYGPHGVGIHLIEGTPFPRPTSINPLADHMSFQSDNLDAVITHLESLNINYIKQKVFEAGIEVVQIFFHDPDHNMIEVCNCDSLPICPLENRAYHVSSSIGSEDNNIQMMIDVRDSFESSDSQQIFYKQNE